MGQTVVRWVFWAFAAVGLYYLLTAHGAHVLDYLPYLLLMACPLMHLLHGHGHHKPDHHTERKDGPSAA